MFTGPIGPVEVFLFTAPKSFCGSFTGLGPAVITVSVEPCTVDPCGCPELAEISIQSYSACVVASHASSLNSTLNLRIAESLLLGIGYNCNY